MNQASLDISNLPGNIAHFLTYSHDNQLLFTSGMFWVMFVVFLPLFALLRNRHRQMVVFVVTFSLYFYYKSSGWYFLLLLALSVIDWHVARLIAVQSSVKSRRKLLAVSLACSLGSLFALKYTNFMLWNFDAIIGRNFQPLDIALPVGISFITFRSVSYVVDVYRGTMEPVRQWGDYVFYLSFFPILLAGPIVRARDFMPQLRDNRPVSAEAVYRGLWLIMTGVIKKAVIADYLAQYNYLVFDNPTAYGGLETLMAVVGYSMQIYCDFSGYSDIAIGLGSVIGFDLGKNFDFPYQSCSITEFWRRWHMSLSFWLRDYIYIPLGGNRRGTPRPYATIMITMLLGGLWHGAAWKFVFWGAGHGLGLCVNKAWSQATAGRFGQAGVARALGSWALTFTFVTLLWVFFRAASFSDACSMISRIFTDFHISQLPDFVLARHTWCLLMGLVVVMHFIPSEFYADLVSLFVESLWIWKLLLFMLVVQLVIEFASADIQPFIYFQF